MDKLIDIHEMVTILRENAPDWRVEILNYDDMLVAFKAGCANWDRWMGSGYFDNIVATYGSQEDKTRLADMYEANRRRLIELSPQLL